MFNFIKRSGKLSKRKIKDGASLLCFLFEKWNEVFADENKKKESYTWSKDRSSIFRKKKKKRISNDIRYYGASGWPKSDRRGDDVSIDRTREQAVGVYYRYPRKKKRKETTIAAITQTDSNWLWRRRLEEKGRFNKKKKKEWNCWTTKAYRGRYLIIYHFPDISYRVAAIV